VLPFSIVLQAGTPIYEQVVYAVRRAVVTGQLRPGDPFPSVRALSMGLKINPNTAHKIVAALTELGLLVVRPGIGTVVGGPKSGSAAARRTILNHDAERLVVDARHAGLSLEQLLQAIRRHWKEMQ
jgi:DNA-binding transcriptional regulator YhcF (GntR family)